MAWLDYEKAPLLLDQKRPFKSKLWLKCRDCSKVQLISLFEKAQNVCVNCCKHYPIKPDRRLASLLDKGSFIEHDLSMESLDPLTFFDSKSYVQRLYEAKEKSKSSDAIVAGEGLIGSIPIQIAVFDFKFMGGSMGSVVGEKIVRTFERSLDSKNAAIIISSSGGARMQEGLLSLMQMAKTCSFLSKIKEEGIPFLSILTNPTTGGVAASYALLGDINIAEPQALIGFAGPRVIQQTIGEKLPEGFQTSEYLFKKGAIDLICHRHKLRETLIRILNIFNSTKRKVFIQ